MSEVRVEGVPFPRDGLRGAMARATPKSPAQGAAGRSHAVSLAMGLCAVAAAWGWWTREELYLTPEDGAGYALGIVGTGMMVALLGYSVRKRMPVDARVGAIRSWFSIHMLLGLFAPLAILYHANFHLGSLNSTVALVCMLLVSGSGVVGRLIYPKIHSGFEGRRGTLRELRAAAEQRRGVLGEILEATAGLEDALAEFESTALGPSDSAAALWPLLFMSRRERRARRRCWRLLKSARVAAGERRRRVVRARMAEVSGYIRTVRAVAEFRAYERLFGLWHALHLPLCIVLFLAAAVHVLAVHMY